MAKRLSRRDLLVGGAATAWASLAGSALSGCNLLKETVVVERTVERVVEATVLVEKPVTRLVEKPVTRLVERATEGQVSGPTNSAGVTLPADALPLEQQVWLLGNTMVGLHGHVMKSRYNRVWAHAMYDEPLVGLDLNGDPYPAACTSYQASTDSLIWTFKLRKDLTFTDGAAVTAGDWAWTLKHALSSGYDAAGYYADIKNAVKVASGQLPADDLGIQAVDDLTLRITTERPTPYLPALLSWFVVMSQRAYETYGEMYELDPRTFNGCGPWTLVSFDRATGCGWQVNQGYKGVRKVYLERCIEGPLPAGLAAYVAGDTISYSVGPNTPAAEMALINTNPVLRAETHPTAPSSTEYLGFNTLPGMFPPLDNPDVRLALCRAIDKRALVAQVGAGFALPAWGMLPTGFPGSNDEALVALDPNRYDVETARQLLSVAGYPAGAGFPELELWCRGGVSPYAQAVQQAWQENLGVRIILRAADSVGYEEQVYGQKAAALYWAAHQADYYDPATFLNLWRDGGRHPCELPGWTAQYNVANSLMDPLQRLEAIRGAEAALVSSVVFLGMASPLAYRMFPCNLAGPGVLPNRRGYATNAGGGALEAYQGLYWSSSKCREPLGQP